MMTTQTTKVLRDLTTDYSRTALLVLAIAIGVVGLGTILGGYAVVMREMRANYTGTRPASATIELTEAISPTLLRQVRRLPTVRAADRRATLTARMQVQHRWLPLLLFVVDDFRHLPISRFHQQSGVGMPPVGTLLVERSALPVMGLHEGGTLTVKTTHGQPKPLRIVGTVHDPALAPAYQEQAGYGYITLETLRWLGETGGFDQLKIEVAQGRNSLDSITTQAQAVARWLEAGGHRVLEIQVPPPNKHPHQGQMNSMLTLFVIFGFLLLVLGATLVSNSMHTLMVRQVRQIGVMKAIGATSGQVARQYLLMVLLVCAVALLVGIPISWLGAKLLYTSIANLLNLNITDHAIPLWVPLAQIAAGTLIPLLAVAVPVGRGSRLSVREALAYFGVAETKPGRLSSRVRWLGETFGLAWRNAFRQRARLAMTLGLLAAGGAMFMGALNVSDAWEVSVGQIYVQRRYDLEIRLDQPIRADALVAKLRAIPGVKWVEAGTYAAAAAANQGPYVLKHTYPDKGHGGFVVQALPVPTRQLAPTLTAGRWLTQPGAADVVLNRQARRPTTQLGDSVTLLLDGKATTWRVVGFSQDIGAPATAYVGADAYARQTGTTGQSTLLRVAFTNRQKAFAIATTRAVDALLEREATAVRSSVPTWVLVSAISGHMRILVNCLLSMALLMALVGSLGLLSTMSLTVLERTREIGVMRAIGATPATIRRLIRWEGLLMGVLSLGLAFGLSLGLSYALGRFIGNLAFRIPLPLTISPLGVLVWVGVVVVGSYLATVFPARRADQLTTREALAYE